MMDEELATAFCETDAQFDTQVSNPPETFFIALAGQTQDAWNLAGNAGQVLQSGR